MTLPNFWILCRLSYFVHCHSLEVIYLLCRQRRIEPWHNIGVIIIAWFYFGKQFIFRQITVSCFQKLVERWRVHSSNSALEILLFVNVSSCWVFKDWSLFDCWRAFSLRSHKRLLAPLAYLSKRPDNFGFWFRKIFGAVSIGRWILNSIFDFLPENVSLRFRQWKQGWSRFRLTYIYIVELR